MTWSLHILNGDLNVHGPGGYAQITGQQKLIQDLKQWILEQAGTDPLHLDFGSNLDGVRLPDGSIQETSIGGQIDKVRLLSIEGEIRRILSAYQIQQADRLQSDSAQYGGKNTFSAGEILYSINNVTLQQVQDVIVALVNITSSDGSALQFVQPVATTNGS